VAFPAYSALLWQQLLTTSPTSPSLLWTSPAGFVTVLRQIDVWCGSGTVTRVDFGEQLADQFFLSLFPQGADHPSASWSGRQVFHPGQTITGQANADFAFCRGSGYVLILGG
jgi:hypothetical protein